MALACQSLYDAAKREVGGGSGSESFQTCFINAINCCLDEMSDEADLAVRHTHITAVSNSISTLYTGHWYIVYAGVIYYLIRMGQRPSDPKTAMLVYQDSEKRWDECKGRYLTRIINDLQSDTTASVVKLGYVGTST